MKLGFDLRDRSIMRRVLRFALIAVLLGFGVNAFLSIFIDRTQLLHALGNVRVIYFAVPLLLFIASYVVDSLRVMLVVSQFKIRLSFVQAFYNSAVGGFFTNITPMTVGGQPFQIYHLSAVGVPVATATNVIMSRFVEQAMTSLCISLLFLAQISWIASTLGMASRLMYVALGISFCATMLLLLILIRPHFIGRLAMRIERTFVGRFVAKVSGAHDWAPKLHRWSHRLRTNVRTLWTEKTWVMVLDTLLGATNTLLHAYSLQFVFYVPTPGASGSVEGAFALVFAGMTKALGPTIIAIFVWRIATFYLLLLFDGLVYAILGRPANSSARRLSGAA